MSYKKSSIGCSKKTRFAFKNIENDSSFSYFCFVSFLFLIYVTENALRFKKPTA